MSHSISNITSKFHHIAIHVLVAPVDSQVQITVLAADNGVLKAKHVYTKPNATDAFAEVVAYALRVKSDVTAKQIAHSLRVVMHEEALIKAFQACGTQ